MHELGKVIADPSASSLQLWIITGAITILGALVLWFMHRFISDFDDWKKNFVGQFDGIQKKFNESIDRQGTKFSEQAQKMQSLSETMAKNASDTLVKQTELKGDLNVAVAKISHYNLSIERQLKSATETAEKVSAGFESLKIEVGKAQEAAGKVTVIQTEQQNTLAAVALAFAKLKQEFLDIKTKIVNIGGGKVLVTEDKKDKKD